MLTLTKRILVFFLFLNSTGLINNLSAQQTLKLIYNDEWPNIGYLEYLPPNYSDELEFPVIIFLHGGGQVGYGSPEELEKVKSWGPPKHIHNGLDFCFTINDKQECFIIISPQLFPTLDKWEPYFVDRVINHVLIGPDNYKVDPDRIYLTGLSRGGHGVYYYAASSLNEPIKLAAIAPIAAWNDRYFDGCIIAGREIPVWAFHGVLDTVIPYENGLSAFNSIKDCSDPVPSAELIFTSYDDRYHDSWIPAYTPDHTWHNPNLYEWFLLHSRTDIISGIKNSKKSLSDLKIYPNPAHDYIYFESPDILSNTFEIIIYNNNGKKVAVFDYLNKRINISKLKKGMYTIYVINKKGQYGIQRFIKKNDIN